MNDRRSNLGVTTSARGQPRRLCEKLPADRGFNATFEFDCTERGRGEYASIVTESSSHLGEAFVRRLSQGGHAVLGLDIREGRLTTRVGSPTALASVVARSASRRSSTRRPCTGRTSTLIADWPSSTPTLPARSICWKLARRQTSSICLHEHDERLQATRPPRPRERRPFG